MKKINFKLILTGGLAATMMLYACKKSFLEKATLGTLDESVLANFAGVQGLLIGAYSMLDGNGGASGGGFYTTPTNWAFAGVASDDAYKGSDAGDQSNESNPIENYTITSSNGPVRDKWNALYDGATRCNDVLRIMAKATGISEDDQKNIAAQARFLRGHYHFDAKRIYNNVPYVDETITYADGNYNVPNTTDIWPMIEADFKFAVDNLPETQDAVGRANKSAAKAYLAKVYMYEHKYAEAKALLDDVLANGKTPKGVKYALVTNFSDNFNAETENNSESVFAVQHSVNDGSGGNNSNLGDVLNFPYNNGTNDMPGGCCGFYQPTQDLVNAYRVDAAGLPFLTDWFSKNVKSDQGIKYTEPFTPETDALDSRLDWTVGRRGIPYLDWGPHPGSNWIRDQSNGGPFAPKKFVYYKSQEKKFTDVSYWTAGVIATNYEIIRFADVILLAAEAEVEVGTLDKAKDLVNMVRARAANPAGWVKKTDGTPAANYKVGLYTSFASQDYARTAVRFERRLELAMEGHRFFDLVRWGIAAETLNAYIGREKTRRTYLANAVFTKGKNEYYPIPQGQIDLTKGALVQNPGY
ncbi:MAG TPA: RagB/SusD family nutrient uptake outer membrane protein [Niastella sp.]|nr:RagB/SusD family nutrient uptake outer membrane protein [Niastella sp.]